MKISHIAAAAGLVIGAFGISASATAQSWNGDRHYQADRDHGRYDQERDRGDWHGRGWRDGGWRHHDRYGWGRHHRDCWTEWHHHHRVRICR